MGRFDILNIYFKWGSLLISRDHYESLGLSESYWEVRGSQWGSLRLSWGHRGSVEVSGAKLRSVGLSGCHWGSVKVIGGSVGVIKAHWGSVRSVYTRI